MKMDAKDKDYEVEIEHYLDNPSNIDWADTWFAFYEAHECLNLSDPEDRALLREHFDELSELWLVRCTSQDMFYDAWVNPETIRDLYNGTIEDAYKDAMATIYYACDRMNINRWLHVRLALNTDVD